MMKGLTKRALFLLAIMGLLFNGCVKYKIVDDNKSSVKVTNVTVNDVQENEILDDAIPTYGDHTEEIEKLLAAIPIGSEVLLEERGDGQWYLKIEKVFVEGKEYLGQSTVTDEPIESDPYVEALDKTLYTDDNTLLI